MEETTFDAFVKKVGSSTQAIYIPKDMVKMLKTRVGTRVTVHIKTIDEKKGLL